MSDPASLADARCPDQALVRRHNITDANLLHARHLPDAVNLSLERGNSDASAVAYAVLGIIAGPRFGDYEARISLRAARL